MNTVPVWVIGIIIHVAVVILVAIIFIISGVATSIAGLHFSKKLKLYNHDKWSDVTGGIPIFCNSLPTLLYRLKKNLPELNEDLAAEAMSLAGKMKKTLWWFGVDIVLILAIWFWRLFQ